MTLLQFREEKLRSEYSVSGKSRIELAEAEKLIVDSLVVWAMFLGLMLLLAAAFL